MESDYLFDIIATKVVNIFYDKIYKLAVKDCYDLKKFKELKESYKHNSFLFLDIFNSSDSDEFYNFYQSLYEYYNSYAQVKMNKVEFIENFNGLLVDMKRDDNEYVFPFLKGAVTKFVIYVNQDKINVMTDEILRKEKKNFVDIKDKLVDLLLNEKDIVYGSYLMKKYNLSADLMVNDKIMKKYKSKIKELYIRNSELVKEKNKLIKNINNLKEYIVNMKKEHKKDMEEIKHESRHKHRDRDHTDKSSSHSKKSHHAESSKEKDLNGEEVEYEELVADV